MVNIDLVCYLKGDKFSELDIGKKTGLVLHSVKQKGKNVTIPIRTFKKVITRTPKENQVDNDDYLTLITKFTDLIKSKKNIIKGIGCEKIVLLLIVQLLTNAVFN